MLKGFFHIFLAISVLASSMGFTVYERLCNMRGQQITLSADHGRCCDHHQPKVEKPKHACCKSKNKPSPVELESKRCCSHKAIFLQAHAGAPVTVTPAHVMAPILVAPLLPLSLDWKFSPVQGFEPGFDSHPKDPPSGRSLRVHFQSFLC